MLTARALDQFYTKPEVAKVCFDFLASHCDLAGAFFLEPSAGAGALYHWLPANARKGLDLDPKIPDVEQQDFFEFNASVLPAGRPVVVVGNPPFGKNSSLALRFINRAAEFASIVAFVLPQTFKKQSVIKRLAPQLHLVAEFNLAPFSFEFQGAPYDVPCVFQVWERRDSVRPTTDTPLTHADFKFVSPEEADFAIRRVGGLAGKVIPEFEGYSPSSHYYIKANDPVRCRALFERICWDEVKHHTAGNPSVSKREVVELYSREAA